MPANHLIREFARKGHYFCSLWVVNDCEETHRYSQEDIDGFEQGPEFLDFMCALPPDSPAFEAGMRIVKWRPAGGK